MCPRISMLTIVQRHLVTSIPMNCQWQWKRSHWMDEEHAFVNVSPAVTAALNNCLLGYTGLESLWTRLDLFLEQLQAVKKHADSDWLRLRQLCLAVWNPNTPLRLTHQSRWSGMQTGRITPVWCVRRWYTARTHESEQNVTESMLLMPQPWSGCLCTLLRCINQDCLRLLDQPDESCHVCKWDTK